MTLADKLRLAADIVEGGLSWEQRKDDKHSWGPPFMGIASAVLCGHEIRIAPEPDPFEALKKAHTEGKVIQMDMRTHWWDFPPDDPPAWDRPVHLYRIKPEPEWVALGPLDWTEGGPWWVRYKRTEAHEKMPFLNAALVTGVSASGIIFSAVPEGPMRSWSFIKAQAELERSRTGREDDWTPCKKLKENN
jgi:hypothetical protein